jgi:hypothetical protein
MDFNEVRGERRRIRNYAHLRVKRPSVIILSFLENFVTGPIDEPLPWRGHKQLFEPEAEKHHERMFKLIGNVPCVLYCVISGAHSSDLCWLTPSDRCWRET